MQLGVGAALAQSAFVPDDPYFNPGSAAGTEPGYYGQWHLHNQVPLDTTNVGLDVNVTGAWQRGLTGQGVIIGVVDDGVQGRHPDLINQFANAYSWDFGKTRTENIVDDYRGAPANALNNHGTEVAGVVAAQGGNGIGITGAAPYAQIASHRLLGVAFSSLAELDSLQAAAIRFQGQTGPDGQPDPSRLPRGVRSRSG